MAERFNIQQFVQINHAVKYYNLEKYVTQLGGKINRIGEPTDCAENEHIKYINFYIGDIKLLGYFHDMSSYDELERPYARFSIVS